MRRLVTNEKIWAHEDDPPLDEMPSDLQNETTDRRSRRGPQLLCDDDWSVWQAADESRLAGLSGSPDSHPNTSSPTSPSIVRFISFFLGRLVAPLAHKTRDPAVPPGLGSYRGSRESVVGRCSASG